MDQLTVPGDGDDDISLVSLSSDPSDEVVPQAKDEDDISVSDIETIDSAAEFKLELCYFIFTHLKKVIGWTSPFLQVTEIIVVMSVYVSIVTATFLVAFHRTYIPVLAFFYASDGIFFIHLLFIVFVALSPTTAWSTPSQLSFRQKCRLHCLIDLVTVIPFELILGHFVSTRDFIITKHISIDCVALGRLNRLIRAYRLVRFFKSKKNDVILGTRYSDILSAACALTLLIHISACVWYLLGCKPFITQYSDLNICWSIKEHGFVATLNTTNTLRIFAYRPTHSRPENSWTLDIVSMGVTDDQHFSFFYIISVYWATVSALSVGYGDYRGLNFNEIRFSISVMLLGSAVTNGLVVGSLTSLLTNVESQRASFAHRLMIIKRYLQDNKYSNELSETIQGFYEYMWFKKKGQSEENIYEALPPSLQSEICLSVNHCALSKSPMFRDLDEGFLRSIALKIQSHFYLPGQIVVSKGTVSRCMYYIVRGELEVLSDRDNCTPVAVLRPGKLFGEVNLVLNFARTATIRAASHCDLLILNQHDVTPVLLHYPDARIAMWEYVQALFEMDFNEPESSSKPGSPPTKRGMSLPKFKSEFTTPSIRFIPSLSPTVGSEESLVPSEDESTAKKEETAECTTGGSTSLKNEDLKDAVLPLLKPEGRDKSSADVVHKSRIPVFKESKMLTGTMSTLSSSMSVGPAQDRLGSSSFQGPSRLGIHYAGSSRKVMTSEMIMQKGDEPIPAFEKPDELHNVTSVASQRSTHFDWKESKPDHLRKQARRPTIVHRPKGTSEVMLSQECSVLKTNAAPHGISRLKQLTQDMMKPRIHEDSAFDNSWKTFVWLVVMVQWFYYLYHASFHDGYSSAELLMTYCMDAVHVVDLVFSMMTVVITPRETYETYGQILRYRAGTVAFYLDLIAALPLDFICLPLTASMESSRRSQLITIFKLNKLTKAWVIYHRFRYFEDQLYIPLQMVRPIETVIYILMGAHLNACLWFMDANFVHLFTGQTGHDKWLDEFIRLKTEEKTLDTSELNLNNSAYLLSLYWAAATMSTTGYGDIVALTTVEYSLSVLTMVLGLVLFSYTLASYASLLTNRDRPKVQFQSIVFAMEKFMLENRLDKLLRERVLRYMDVQWNAYDGLVMPGRQPLLHDLPEALQQDLAADGIVKLLDNVPLFRGTDVIFRQELSSRCSRYLFPPNELVLYSGDLGRDMYIIIRGYCESYLGKRQKSLGLMGPGEYFGEAGMLFGLPRPAHVITRTHCSLLAIPHGEFQRILKKYPTVNMEIRDIQEDAAILRSVKLNHARVWRLSKDLPPSDDSLFQLDQPQSFTTFPEKDSENEYRRPFAELGGLGSLLARLLMSRTVRPDGRAAVQMECFRIAIIVLVVVVTPVHITFAWKSFSIYAVGILFDIVAMVYVYLRLHWAYYDKTSTLITHPIATAQNYLASAFLLDLVGCFPFDLIAMLFFQGNIYANLHVIVLFRVNRMIQVYEILWALYHWERRMVFRSGIFKAMKYLWHFVTYVHIIACVWAYIACPAWLAEEQYNEKGIEGRIHGYYVYNKTQFMETHKNCRTYSWYSTSPFAANSNSSLDLYIISILYTLEMVASVGYGDMTPQSRIEFILSIVLMLHGVMFFGFVIASVTASFVNADMTRANFNETVKELAEQMRYELVPQFLQTKVLKHVEYEFFRSQGMDAHSLFANLPPSIRGDVAIVLFEDLISSVPIFKTIDRSFHRMLAMCLKEAFFLEGETVLYAGDMGEEMFFIHRGFCDIVDADGKALKSLGPGRFFGEVSVMFSIPRTVTIKARTNADLFILTKNDLQDVLENYPGIRREIERIAIERLRTTGQGKVSKSEQFRREPRKSESGVRTRSLTSSGLMEARHGRKHKTHHRRSFVDQVTDALTSRGISKDRQGEHAINHQTLEDEYKALLHSEEYESRQKGQRRHSLQAPLLKHLMQKIISSHSTAPDPNDKGEVDEHARADDSAVDRSIASSKKGSMEVLLKEQDKSGASRADVKSKLSQPGVDEEQKVENKPKEDHERKMGNDPQKSIKPKVQDVQMPEDRHKVDNKVKVERNAKQDADGKVSKAEQAEEPAGKVMQKSTKTHSSQIASEREPGKSSDLDVRKESSVTTPKLPPISSKHMSQSSSVKLPKVNVRQGDSEHNESPIPMVPSIRFSPSEDVVSIASKGPSKKGSTDVPLKEQVKSDASRSTESPRMPADSGADVRSVEAPSHPVKKYGSVHEMYISSRPGSNVSSTHISPMSSDVKLSAKTSTDKSNALNKSKVSTGSTQSVRSPFRPPVWLDACLGRIIQQARKTVSPDFIINPKSRLLLFFNLLLALLGAMSIMVLFYQMAFLDFSPTLNWSLLGISLIYTINIFIRMHTAYYDNYGDLVCDQSTVKKKYIRRPTGLLIDVLSALPVGILALIHPGSPEMLRAIHKVRFGQLARCYTVINFFRSWEGLLNAPVLLLRSLRDVGFLLLLLHIWSCFWFMAACPSTDCIEGSWIHIRQLGNCSNHEKYMNAVYFIAATMTSTGYGEIHPNTMQEVIVCIGAIIVGKFAFGLVIGDLASTLSNLEVARVEMETTLAVIVNQMKDQMVPKHLQKRVRHHVEYDWLRNRGHSLKGLLQHVPYCLRMEVFETIYGNQLRSISIFESAPDYVIRRLSALCEQQLFLPGDFITKKGDIGRRVYIIRRGSVVVYRTSPAEPEYFLYSGSIYGDVQMVYPTIPYEHHLVADYPSDVLVISQEDIQLLLADHPHFYFRVRRYIQKKYADIVHDKRPSMSVRGSIF